MAGSSTGPASNPNLDSSVGIMIMRQPRLGPQKLDLFHGSQFQGSDSAVVVFFINASHLLEEFKGKGRERLFLAKHPFRITNGHLFSAELIRRVSTPGSQEQTVKASARTRMVELLCSLEKPSAFDLLGVSATRQEPRKLFG